MFGAVEKQWGLAAVIMVLSIPKIGLRRSYSTFQVELRAPDNGDGQNLLITAK